MVDKNFRVIDPLVGGAAGLVLAWWMLLDRSKWATAFATSKSGALFTAGSADGVLLG